MLTSPSPPPASLVLLHQPRQLDRAREARRARRRRRATSISTASAPGASSRMSRVHGEVGLPARGGDPGHAGRSRRLGQLGKGRLDGRKMARLAGLLLHLDEGDLAGLVDDHRRAVADEGHRGCCRPYFLVTSSIGSASRSCLMPLACFQALCDHVESRLMPTTTVSAPASTGSWLILQFSFSQVGLQSSGYHKQHHVLALVGGELPLLLVLGLEREIGRDRSDVDGHSEAPVKGRGFD